MVTALKSDQQFRGGDAFTSILAADDTFSEWRSKLVGQAGDEGMKTPYAKEWAEFAHKDVGPDPGSPWWKANLLRGVDLDFWSTVTNGTIGTKNSAGALAALLPTHFIPQSWNPLFENTFGAAVHESFSWEE
ncbi:hypothetical protein OG586_00670 [Streptomyces murinus]|uniref:hypothetical protein n=1 Tax=Streptomyces murinus TaxID=33900 RepID=UPI002E808007|nr:hypothetical protein [Streptomyces murinus]WUD04821.1 hypothetical protein OG586_00670 [Streptomyces murinus]